MFFDQSDNFYQKQVQFEYDPNLSYISQVIEMGEFDVVKHNIKKGQLEDNEVLILSIIKGQGIVKDNDEELALISGDIYRLDNNSDYLISNNNWSLIYLLLKGDHIQELVDQTLKKYEFDLQSRTRFDQLFDKLNISAIKDRNTLVSSGHLLNFLSEVNKTSSSHLDKRTEIIRESILYIENHFAEAITLVELAQHVGYSKFYFSRLFKEYLGMSFVDYLHKRRILESVQLLETTTLSVTQILLEVGYDYEANFYKYFNKYFKITPNEYRHKILKKRKNY